MMKHCWDQSFTWRTCICHCNKQHCQPVEGQAPWIKPPHLHFNGHLPGQPGL